MGFRCLWREMGNGQRKWPSYSKHAHCSGLLDNQRRATEMCSFSDPYALRCARLHDMYCYHSFSQIWINYIAICLCTSEPLVYYMFYPFLLLDHIEGLTRQFPYRIYCTPVTARLLRQKFSFAYELLVSWITIDEFCREYQSAGVCICIHVSACVSV